MRGWRRWTATAALLLGAAACVWAAGRMLSVQVREGRLRDKPSFLGRTVAEVAYGDRLEAVDTRGGWTKVRDTAGREGWLHTSALSEKRIVLRSGEADVETGASGEELALAGKGFNDEVEARFREENPDIDFTWVDRMERIVVDADEARDFLAEGGVEPEEGGAS